MPEGPEIWRSADKLHKALAKKEIQCIHFAFDELKDFEDTLEGEDVEKVEACGKAIITYFSNSQALYSHNQLYGKWIISDRGVEPDTNRQLRVAIHNDEKSAFLYSASDIELMNREAVDDHSYIKKLGPDPLHPDTSYDDITGRFRDSKFQNRKMTSLLLDQSFISGIGNYLRSEILFYAGVNPSQKLRRCSQEEKQKLAEATVTLTQRSYKTGGITNDPDIVEALKRENVQRKNYRHFVYKRTSKRCYKCGGEVEEEKIGGRKIYYCPACQLNH